MRPCLHQDFLYDIEPQGAVVRAIAAQVQPVLTPEIWSMQEILPAPQENQVNRFNTRMGEMGQKARGTGLR
jgi:hypothetical protein